MSLLDGTSAAAFGAHRGALAALRAARPASSGPVVPLSALGTAGHWHAGPCELRLACVGGFSADAADAAGASLRAEGAFDKCAALLRLFPDQRADAPPEAWAAAAARAAAARGEPPLPEGLRREIWARVVAFLEASGEAEAREREAREREAREREARAAVPGAAADADADASGAAAPPTTSSSNADAVAIAGASGAGGAASFDGLLDLSRLRARAAPSPAPFASFGLPGLPARGVRALDLSDNAGVLFAPDAPPRDLAARFPLLERLSLAGLGLRAPAALLPRGPRGAARWRKRAPRSPAAGPAARPAPARPARLRRAARALRRRARGAAAPLPPAAAGAARARRGRHGAGRAARAPAAAARGAALRRRGPARAARRHRRPAGAARALLPPQLAHDARAGAAAARLAAEPPRRGQRRGGAGAR
jgi:hypothetical protein